jgi:hypothetical protein
MYSATWLNRLFYELHQAVPGSVRNALHANPSDAGPIVLSGNHNQGLTLRLSAPHSLLQTTQKGFVHLHPPRQPIATRPYHRSPELVQPRPRGLIAAQPQQTLCRPRALAPFFWLANQYMARNQFTSGLRVSWKIVPAVSDV